MDVSLGGILVDGLSAVLDAGLLKGGKSEGNMTGKREK